MPFRLVTYGKEYGLPWWERNSSVYCQTDTSASDYGKCYNVFVPWHKAYFVETDTATYPTLPCESDGTCIRITNPPFFYTLDILYDFASTGKQGIVKWFYSLTHCSITLYEYQPHFQGFIVPNEVDNYELIPTSVLAVTNPFGSPPFLGYDPLINSWIYVDRYKIPVGYVNEYMHNDSFFMTKLMVGITIRRFNRIYFAGKVIAGVLMETSPIAVIPLDYSEYLKYNELRRAFGYSTDGINQPGWNAADMIRVLKELFPDRAWMVLDDKDSMLYLWNVNFPDVPEWLLQRLSPTSVKVLKSPSSLDAEKSLFTLLEQRNNVIQ